MYIQITTRCNMTCAHCCMSATHQGEDMSRETFLQALTLAMEIGDIVTLGGGEPTAHKEFLPFLEKTVQMCGRYRTDIPPLVITNGKLKTKVNKMLDMVERGAFLSVDMSMDDYHDPVHHDIEWRFRDLSERLPHSQGGGVGIRTVNSLGPWGRAADPARGLTINPALADSCMCDDLFVSPDGTVWACGCKEEKLGHLNSLDSEALWMHDRSREGRLTTPKYLLY